MCTYKVIKYLDEGKSQRTLFDYFFETMFLA